ncbi:hypothetical protein [Bosea sp. (in: a-proteobacteria)]|uniref:hypothetical protein n=1 Tax=Bosea sp. (in: a-proteobacteria) TaxID=1871050 RepID=UPI003561DF51
MPPAVLPAPTLHRAAWLLLLAAMPLAAAHAEQTPAQQAPDARPLDAAFSEEAETRLFAPIPHWDATPSRDPDLDTPGFMAPMRHKGGRTVGNGLARPQIDAVPIRRGLSPASSPLPAATERAVGVKLGAERLSLSTAIVTGQGGWQRNDTRVDWNVTRGSGGDSQVVWSAATGGQLQTTGAAAQNAEAVLGYRLRPLDIVTLTTEIALAGSYTFAAQNGLATTMTPRVKAVADLTQPLSMPWRTTLDLNVGREMPLSGSAFLTSASALLRLELPMP